jgi:hypothetical protein
LVAMATCAVVPLFVPMIASAYFAGHGGGGGSSQMLLSMVTRKRVR